MPTKPRIQTRVPDDVKDALNEYAKDHDRTEADALRRIVTSELQREGYLSPIADGGPPDTMVERIASAKTAIAGTILTVLGYLPLLLVSDLLNAGHVVLALALGVLAVAMILSGVATVWAAAIAQVALARPLKSLLFGEKEEA